MGQKAAAAIKIRCGERSSCETVSMVSTGSRGTVVLSLIAVVRSARWSATEKKAEGGGGEARKFIVFTLHQILRVVLLLLRQRVALLSPQN